MSHPSDPAAISATWDLVLSELRKLRGQNLWRGSAVQLRQRNILRLEAEWRGSLPKAAYWEIHIGSDIAHLWARRHPDGEERPIGVGADLVAWLSGILADCRGGSYLHTNSKVAEYRKALVKE